MNPLILIGALLGLFMFVPQYHAIKHGRPQNVASWGLWSLIAMISTGSILAQKGNYLLPAAYCFSDMNVVIVSLFYSGKIRWSWFESVTVMLVLACLDVWVWSGPRAATIMAAAAHLIAGLPQFVDTYRRPKDTPSWSYLGFAIAGMLSTAGGKDWSVAEALYPFTTGLYCLAVALTAFLRSQKA